jgi:hypothetical protein
MYSALALVFAELTEALIDWQHALEEWNMRESQVVLGWQREAHYQGRLDTKREDVISLLELRFQVQIPADLRRAIEGTNDLDILTRWFAAAATVPSLEAFRAGMSQ